MGDDERGKKMSNYGLQELSPGEIAGQWKEITKVGFNLGYIFYTSSYLTLLQRLYIHVYQM